MHFPQCQHPCEPLEKASRGGCVCSAYVELLQAREVSPSVHRSTRWLFKVVLPDGCGNQRLVLSVWHGRGEWKDWTVSMVFS